MAPQIAHGLNKKSIYLKSVSIDFTQRKPLHLPATARFMINFCYDLSSTRGTSLGIKK